MPDLIEICHSILFGNKEKSRRIVRDSFNKDSSSFNSVTPDDNNDEARE
jgi:hypothetical protein